MVGDGLDRDGNLRLTLATWVYRLHAAGITPDDAELSARCADVAAATDRETGDEAGEALVNRVVALVGDKTSPEDVVALARRLYGEKVTSELGQGDREERVARIRKYQFGRNLPWLARIWERQEQGVGPSWLLVQRVTDEVDAMDPNPWNDVDEDRRIPVGDFQVLWELDLCTAVAVS